MSISTRARNPVTFIQFSTGELAKQPPNNSLIHFLPITSLLLQLGAIGGFQVLVWYLTLGQDWFTKYNTDDPTYHNSTYSNKTWSNLPGGNPEQYYIETGIDDSEVSENNSNEIGYH